MLLVLWCSEFTFQIYFSYVDIFCVHCGIQQLSSLFQLVEYGSDVSLSVTVMLLKIIVFYLTVVGPLQRT